MKLIPQFSYDGTASEAIDFYIKTFNATVKFKMTWAESPACKEVPDNWQDKIMHATLDLGDATFFVCDPPPEKFRKAAGTATAISAKTVEEGKQLFDALAEGGNVGMPFQKTFWSDGFGFVTDRFGIPWMVNTDTPQQL